MRFLILAGVLLFLVADAHALFIRPDLQKIPVERLVKNLEEKAEKEPKNAQVRFNLARLHGMAYAKKTDMVEINTKSKEEAPWFGFTPAFVPFAKIVETKDEAVLKAAKQHLDKAIAAYREALKLQPDNLAAELGLAWCLEQSGQKKEALEAYRKVVEKGWEKDKERKSGPIGGHFITKEAAEYLLPLLDAKADAEEAATLRERTAKLAKLPRPVTPIAIPLEDLATLAELLDPRARVRFDADGSGLSKQWTWITPKAGWLVMDSGGKGRITSALQLFGNVTFWTFWDNGYQALSLLDDNHDGELTGRELEGLAIWHDVNGNGVSEPGEVRSLAAHGIVSLSCRFEALDGQPDCPVWSPRGVRYRSGMTRPSFDVILRSR